MSLLDMQGVPVKIVRWLSKEYCGQHENGGSNTQEGINGEVYYLPCHRDTNQQSLI
jgi:hypothetical protein